MREAIHRAVRGPTRPFVLYGYTRPGPLYLVKDLAADTVTLSQ